MLITSITLSPQTIEIVSAIIIGIASLGYAIFWVVKNFPKSVKKMFDKSISDEKEQHIIATQYRKKIMPKIKTMLCELATDVEADRALLFEYSDGVSNLVGLPFLYITATLEVVRPGISSVIKNYQKTNVLIVSDFMEQLELNGYMYFKDIEEIKEKYPIVYGFMHPNNAKSGLFYSVYDENNAIGFVVVTTVKETFERHDVLPRVAACVQRISALLNYDKIKSELE